MRRDKSDRIYNRFAAWSVVLIALSAFSLIGQAAAYFGSIELSAVPITVCTFVMLLCGILIFRGKSSLLMEEIPSEQ